MENNIKVGKTHRLLAILYGMIAVIWLSVVVVTARNTDHATTDTSGACFIFVFLSILHGFVAKGCFAKNETSRVVSIIIGVLMLFAFPIGTFFSISLLSNTKPWTGSSGDALTVTEANKLP